jgi:predicted ABC-type ATPase
MVTTEKRILIIAGPNGAGKTTFTSEFLTGDQLRLPFVNADIIASALNPAHPEAEAFRAGRLMLEKIQELVDSGESFAFETTLSGLAYSRSVPVWQSRGYEVELYFLSLQTAELAIERVRNRVTEGGHHVPEDVIRRRFDAGLRNFHQIYKDLVDRWSLLNNTDYTATLVEEGSKE